eukprot:Gb_12500 [translate_table: standard]
MSGGSGSVSFMATGKPNHTNTRMSGEGSSPTANIKFAVEETTEAKEWITISHSTVEPALGLAVGEPLGGIESSSGKETTILTVNGDSSTQHDDSCQDDMFSFAELSAVEDHSERMVVETTVCTATVATSVEGQRYEQELHSGGAPLTIPVSSEIGEHNLQEMNSREPETGIKKIVENAVGAPTEGVAVEPQVQATGTDMEQFFSNVVPLNGSAVEAQINECHPQDSVLQSQPQEESKNENYTSESFMPSVPAFEDAGKHLSFQAEELTCGVAGEVDASVRAHVSEKDDAVEATGGVAGEVRAPVEKELPEFDMNLPFSKSDVSELAKVSPSSTYDLNEKMQDMQQEDSIIQGNVIEEECQSNQHGTECIGDQLQLPTEAKDAADASIGCKQQESSCQLNQVSLDNSHWQDLVPQVQNVAEKGPALKEQEDESHQKKLEMVATKEQEDESHQKKPEMAVTKEQEDESHQKKRPEMAVTKEQEDESHQKKFEPIATKEEEEESHQRQLEMASVKEQDEESQQKQPEHIASLTQVALGVDDQLQYKDHKLSTFPGQPASSHTADMPHAMPVSETVESQKIEVGTVGLPDSAKQGYVSDLNHPVEGLSENATQSEQTPQVAHILTRHESTPDIPQDGTAESNAEPLEYRDGLQSDDMQSESDLLKGRKVCKRFGKKKFLGEVIGYDPESQWYKVLYEDGDEEELEKHELDGILLPLNNTKASVSRKRRLSTHDDESDEPERSKKVRKHDSHSTPGKAKKDGNVKEKNQTPSSQQRSGEKKNKSYATKPGGKSESSKAHTPKTKQGKNKGSLSAKKSIEKKDGPKKSQSSHTKKSRKDQTKQDSLKKRPVDVMSDSEKQHASATKKLKYGSTKKTMSTKSGQKSVETPEKAKTSRSGRTLVTPERYQKLKSVEDVHANIADQQVDIPEVSMTERSEVDTPKPIADAQGISQSKPGRKRKAGFDFKGELSTVDSRRAKKEKTLNDEESPAGRSVGSKMPLEEAKLEVSQERQYKVKLFEKEEKIESSLPSTGKRRGRADRGIVLVGRKVKKDFDGKLYNGEIIGYKMFYKVKYEDGDSEDLTWKELESILVPIEEERF